MTTTNSRTATSTPSPATSAACSGCGNCGTDPVERYELAMEWLLPGPDGMPVAKHFCRACAPQGDIDEITCARCGDGPLLAGQLTQLDLHASAAIDAHLTADGWRIAGPVCPDCLRDMSR